MNDKPPPSGIEVDMQQTVDERTVTDLHAQRLLTDDARNAALAWLAPQRHWWTWANRALLFVGSALALCGVVFFFAYNWSRIPAIAKFGVIEMGLWACAVGAWRTGLERITGKVLLLAACVLVGVLLGVYGQTYQTGADAFENFALWALLILPWVVVGRFGALWMLWLTVVNTAVVLFWVQVDAPDGFEFVFGVFLILALINGLLLALGEIAAKRGAKWLAHDWLRLVVWGSILVYLSIPAIAFIIDPEFGNGSLLGGAALLAVLLGGYRYYRHVLFDLLALGLGVTALCIVGLTLAGRLLFEISDDPPAVLLFGLIVLATTSAAAIWLRRLSRERTHVLQR